MNIKLVDALNELGISAYCKNNDYDTIVWTDPKKTVLKADLESKVAEMQKAEDATQYQRDRADAYPSWQDQMDLLYHGGVDALKTELKKTKDKYPKPT